MNKYIYILFLLFISSCYKADSPNSGFLSDDVKSSSDTLFIGLGGTGSSEEVWLDGSTAPCTFELVNITDKNGKRAEQFFQTYPTDTWIKPYDFMIDKTMDAILAKIEKTNKPALALDPLNGKVYYYQASANFKNIGDVFHVEARVKNIEGIKELPKFLTMKLVKMETPYTFNDLVNAIIIVDEQGANKFPFYDQIASSKPNYSERKKNIYADNGKELIALRKISNEPLTGVKIIFKLLDEKGRVFDPSKYETYPGGTTFSYLDWSVNRQNTPEGVIMEFPSVPWPARAVGDAPLSYLKGATITDFSLLDMKRLKKDILEGRIVPLNEWPADDYAKAKAWYVRLRSNFVIEENGTWEISCIVPYSSIDGNFN